MAASTERLWDLSIGSGLKTWHYCPLVRYEFKEARFQLAISCIILISFAWLFIWLISLIKPGLWAAVLEFAPDFFQKLIAVLSSPTAHPPRTDLGSLPRTLCPCWCAWDGLWGEGPK